MRITNVTVKEEPTGYWQRYGLYIEMEDDETPSKFQRVYDTKVLSAGQSPAFRNHGAPVELFFHEQGGWVDFLYYNGPSDGFGGARFNIKVRNPDGTIVDRELFGPWSYNAEAMAREGFTQAVSVTTLPGHMSRHITLEYAKKLLEEYNLPYEYVNYHPHYQEEPSEFCFVLAPKK